MSQSPNILIFNAGSSSLKFGLFHVGDQPKLLLGGTADGIGTKFGKLTATDVSGETIYSVDEPFASAHDAAVRAFGLLDQFDAPSPDAIGHRIVHGGPRIRNHVLIDDNTMRQLEAATAFAPLHIPSALAILKSSQSEFPDVPQAICLDTTFHAQMPEVARYFPLSQEFADRGIFRYGFHGLSCESIIRRLGAQIPSRLIVAHLGGGCSITAIKDGKSIDNSMGLTPSGGTMMSTRSGNLDPGLLLYLLRSEGYSPDSLEVLLNQKSGLAGVSGSAGDLRELRCVENRDQRAKFAIDMFCYSARKHIASMASSLGGLDLLVFTGGIGEHDIRIREEICSGLSWIGSYSARTMRSMEEEQIAIHVAAMVSGIPR